MIDHVVDALKSAAKRGSFGHAYLFSGGTERERDDLARLAMDLLCKANHVVGGPVRGIEDMRERDRNGLLKALEMAYDETEFKWTYILLAEDATAVPPTIRSRTQHFDLGGRVYLGDAQTAKDALDKAEAHARLAVEQAQAHLRDIQESAAISEAKLRSIYRIDEEMAEFEFAGSGMVVNIYGLPADNAEQIAEAIQWVERTKAQPALTEADIRRIVREELDQGKSDESAA